MLPPSRMTPRTLMLHGVTQRKVALMHFHAESRMMNNNEILINLHILLMLSIIRNVLQRDRLY